MHVTSFLFFFCYTCRLNQGELCVKVGKAKPISINTVDSRLKAAPGLLGILSSHISKFENPVYKPQHEKISSD